LLRLCSLLGRKHGRGPAEARVALTGPEQAPRLRAGFSFRDCWSQLTTFVLDAEHLLAQRLAGTVFLIRVVSALLAFGSQVLFARWMGSFEFGIYVYVQGHPGLRPAVISR
jgi:hypothetical protein